jgi:endonuclease YncB( thermonuclease family)
MISPCRAALVRSGLLAGAAVLALATAGGPGPAARAGERLAGPVPAAVIAVVDGDTLSVRAHIWLGQRVETLVRLAGVDAPELRGKCERERALAAQARDFLRARLGPREAASGGVLLRDIRLGKYAGRVLARVQGPDGADLAELLLAEGLARRYAGRERPSWCGAGAGPASARLSPDR